ncbi:GAF domain-containing protein [Gryllotalpicola protaetiae]|uniref:Transcriptional regulator n=1 Tax=Gryllotalpicola protaetiae TaxID=2419771 RepID=A0A387BKC8_9MICO|nr:GAF domain-containing protein [Gryllotalpicola protaetiae]AYG02614.1 transcriptional regulator [Gryllotalpicola protaetiae]
MDQVRDDGDAGEWLALPGRSRPRGVVLDSWRRARERRLDPERVLPALELDAELDDYRNGHRLASVMPLIRRLLVRDVDGEGLLVAVGDELGRLLWVEGDQAARQRAERMLFVAGANWAEDRVGTSAPGTALALDHGIQIHDTDHFDTVVHGWSCTAVPIHDPETRRILGVIDITGDARAIAPFTLPLLEATAAAAESQLLAERLAERMRPRPAPRRPAPAAASAVPVLHLLGRDTGELDAGGRITSLSARHATILALLSWHRQGLSSEALRELAYPQEAAEVTLRAELVRLRRVLASALPGVTIDTHPYRLSRALELDAHQVLTLLERGAHRVALAAYAGPLLPGSTAPGIAEIRETLRQRLRDALLTDASADVLVQYAATPDGSVDAAVLREALRQLPPHSPKRAAIVERLEALER